MSSGRPRSRFYLKATLYDKRGKVLSVGYNSYHKTHPLQGKLAKEAGREDAIFLHAEIHALTKCKDWDQIHTIYIERYDKKGNPRLAKPCEICTQALSNIGVKKIEYTYDHA